MVSRPPKLFKRGDAVRFTAAAVDQAFRLKRRAPEVFMVYDAETNYVWYAPGAGCWSYRLEPAEGPW